MAATTELLAVSGVPDSPIKPLGSPASHQPEIPFMADGYGPVNNPTGSVLPAGSDPTSARLPGAVANGEPGALNNKAMVQVTGIVKLLTVALVPVAVSTQT